MNKLTYILLAFLLYSCYPENKEILLAEKATKQETLKSTEIKTIDEVGGLKIISWNIRDLGGSKSKETLLEISEIINKGDVAAIQEVVAKDPKGAQAVAKIADELNRMGAKWDYSISPPTRSPSAYSSERYAYLWRTSKVKLLQKAYLDSDLEKVCVREPYIANFIDKKRNVKFSLVNFHSKKHDESPEEEIKYFINYHDDLKTSNLIILGDFNLDEKHFVWKVFYKKGFVSGLKETPTTLKRKCSENKYTYHSIDNFYIKTNDFVLSNSGVIDFVQTCDNLDKNRKISDHLPIFISLSQK